jgi:hypothetical protein
MIITLILNNLSADMLSNRNKSTGRTYDRVQIEVPDTLKMAPGAGVIANLGTWPTAESIDFNPNLSIRCPFGVVWSHTESGNRIAPDGNDRLLQCGSDVHQSCIRCHQHS